MHSIGDQEAPDGEDVELGSTCRRFRSMGGTRKHRMGRFRMERHLLPQRSGVAFQKAEILKIFM